MTSGQSSMEILLGCLRSSDTTVHYPALQKLLSLSQRTDIPTLKLLTSSTTEIERIYYQSSLIERDRKFLADILSYIFVITDIEKSFLYRLHGDLVPYNSLGYQYTRKMLGYLVMKKNAKFRLAVSDLERSVIHNLIYSGSSFLLNTNCEADCVDFLFELKCERFLPFLVTPPVYLKVIAYVSELCFYKDLSAVLLNVCLHQKDFVMFVRYFLRFYACRVPNEIEVRHLLANHLDLVEIVEDSSFESKFEDLRSVPAKGKDTGSENLKGFSKADIQKSEKDNFQTDKRLSEDLKGFSKADIQKIEKDDFQTDKRLSEDLKGFSKADSEKSNICNDPKTNNSRSENLKGFSKADSEKTQKQDPKTNSNGDDISMSPDNINRKVDKPITDVSPETATHLIFDFSEYEKRVIENAENLSKSEIVDRIAADFRARTLTAIQAANLIKKVRIPTPEPIRAETSAEVLEETVEENEPDESVKEVVINTSAGSLLLSSTKKSADDMPDELFIDSFFVHASISALKHVPYSSIHASNHLAYENAAVSTHSPPKESPGNSMVENCSTSSLQHTDGMKTSAHSKLMVENCSTSSFQHDGMKSPGKFIFCDFEGLSMSVVIDFVLRNCTYQEFLQILFVIGESKSMLFDENYLRDLVTLRKSQHDSTATVEDVSNSNTNDSVNNPNSDKSRHLTASNSKNTNDSENTNDSMNNPRDSDKSRHLTASNPNTNEPVNPWNVDIVLRVANNSLKEVLSDYLHTDLQVTDPIPIESFMKVTSRLERDIESKRFASYAVSNAFCHYGFGRDAVFYDGLPYDLSFDTIFSCSKIDLLSLVSSLGAIRCNAGFQTSDCSERVSQLNRMLEEAVWSSEVSYKRIGAILAYSMSAGYYGSSKDYILQKGELRDNIEEMRGNNEEYNRDVIPDPNLQNGEQCGIKDELRQNIGEQCDIKEELRVIDPKILDPNPNPNPNIGEQCDIKEELRDIKEERLDPNPNPNPNIGDQCDIKEERLDPNPKEELRDINPKLVTKEFLVNNPHIQESLFREITTRQTIPQTYFRTSELPVTDIVEDDFAHNLFAVLGELLPHTNCRFMSVAGLLSALFLYSDTQPTCAFVREAIMPLLYKESIETVGFCCFVLGALYCGTADLELQNYFLSIYTERSETDSESVFFLLIVLGASLIFLNRPDLANCAYFDNFGNYRHIFTAMAYVGSSQKEIFAFFLDELSRFEEIEAEDNKNSEQGEQYSVRNNTNTVHTKEVILMEQNTSKSHSNTIEVEQYKSKNHSNNFEGEQFKSKSHSNNFEGEQFKSKNHSNTSEVEQYTSINHSTTIIMEQNTSINHSNNVEGEQYKSTNHSNTIGVEQYKSKNHSNNFEGEQFKSKNHSNTSELKQFGSEQYTAAIISSIKGDSPVPVLESSQNHSAENHGGSFSVKHSNLSESFGPKQNVLSDSFSVSNQNVFNKDSLNLNTISDSSTALNHNQSKSQSSIDSISDTAMSCIGNQNAVECAQGISHSSIPVNSKSCFITPNSDKRSDFILKRLNFISKKQAEVRMAKKHGIKSLETDSLAVNSLSNSDLLESSSSCSSYDSCNESWYLDSAQKDRIMSDLLSAFNTIESNGRVTTSNRKLEAHNLSRSNDLSLNTADHNTCNHNACNHNIGNHNACNHNTCNHNTCNHNTCNHNTCNHNACNHNIGNHNACNHNTCNLSACNHNTCDHNIGNHNTCDHNIGNHNACNLSAYNHNTCDHNIGNHNTCNHNTFNHNTCNLSACNHNTCNLSACNHNTCNHNIGNHNIGNHNTCNLSACNHNTCNHCTTDHNACNLSTGNNDILQAQKDLPECRRIIIHEVGFSEDSQYTSSESESVCVPAQKMRLKERLTVLPMEDITEDQSRDMRITLSPISTDKSSEVGLNHIQSERVSNSDRIGGMYVKRNNLSGQSTMLQIPLSTSNYARFKSYEKYSNNQRNENNKHDNKSLHDHTAPLYSFMSGEQHSENNKHGNESLHDHTAPLYNFMSGEQHSENNKHHPQYDHTAPLYNLMSGEKHPENNNDASNEREEDKSSNDTQASTTPFLGDVSKESANSMSGDLLTQNNDSNDDKEPETLETHAKSMLLLAITLLALNDQPTRNICKSMFMNLIGKDTTNILPLLLGILFASNPDTEIIDCLSRTINTNEPATSIMGLSLIGAGTNNTRICKIIEAQYGYHSKASKIMHLGQVASGIIHLGKGTLAISPFYSQNTSINKRALIALSAFTILFMGNQTPIISKWNFLFYLLTPAIKNKYLITMDQDLNFVTQNIRIGRPSNINPENLTGITMQESPVIVQEDERAEIPDEINLKGIAEGVVIISHNKNNLQ